MDNQEFLTLFNSLADERGNSKMVSSSEQLIELITYKQIITEKQKKDDTPENINPKYQLYEKIMFNPSNDLLYSLRRLVLFTIIN